MFGSAIFIYIMEVAMKHFNEILKEHCTNEEWREMMISGLVRHLNHVLADKEVDTDYMDIIIRLEENGISSETAQRVCVEFCKNSSLYDDDVMDYSDWTADYYRTCDQLFNLMAGCQED